MPVDQDTKVSALDSFREALEALLEIAQALHPECDSVADLIGVVELAQINDGQLKLLMRRVQMAASNQKAKPR
jgi:hypothetical protein